MSEGKYGRHATVIEHAIKELHKIKNEGREAAEKFIDKLALSFMDCNSEIKLAREDALSSIGSIVMFEVDREFIDFWLDLGVTHVYIESEDIRNASINDIIVVNTHTSVNTEDMTNVFLVAAFAILSCRECKLTPKEKSISVSLIGMLKRGELDHLMGEKHVN